MPEHCSCHLHLTGFCYLLRSVTVNLHSTYWLDLYYMLYVFTRAAVRLKTLIAINRTIKFLIVINHTRK